MLRTHIQVVFMTLFIASIGLGDDRQAVKKHEAIKRSKLEKTNVATTVDFVDSLKLPFQSLTTLGSRIEAARLASDPIILGGLARELAVAEKVSGRRGALTAAALVEETTALVKLRNHSRELEAVALLLDDEQARSALQKLAVAAKKRESDQAQALKDGEVKKGLQGTLIIVNLHDIPMFVYTNGELRGVAAPFHTDYFYVNNPPGYVSVFEVRYPNGSYRSRWVLTDNVPVFRWTIDPAIP